LKHSCPQLFSADLPGCPLRKRTGDAGIGKLGIVEIGQHSFVISMLHRKIMMRAAPELYLLRVTFHADILTDIFGRLHVRN
jgi:hypothetical protein